jgi:GNAT superfamily N-acetyltransferase
MVDMKRKDVHRWFRPVRAPMSIASYRRLPRHPAYKFEYWDGQLRITPRWNSHAMFLALRSPEEAVVPELEGASIRLLQDGDWDELPKVLGLAFADAPPLSVLRGRRRVWASRDWLWSTRDGDEGRLVQPACAVAVDRNDSTRLLGALIVTLMAGFTRSWYVRRRLAVPPPAPDLGEGGEQPQISWVFVHPAASGRGVGRALLAMATRSLWNAGYRELASATDCGNVTSMAWHWRNGFVLLPDRSADVPRRSR